MITVDDPSQIMTISNHADARQLGARVNLDHLADRAPASTFMLEYVALAAKGEFQLPVARTYPLSEWREAVTLSMSGHPHGKIIVRPTERAPR